MTSQRLRALTLLAALALPFAAAPGLAAGGNNGDVSLTTTALPTLNPGQTSWVSTLWKGVDDGEKTGEARNFRLTATGPGLTISYPTNTGAFSSLYKSSTLLVGDTDYAALKIVVGAAVTGPVQVTLQLDYDLVTDKKKSKTEARQQTLALTLPVAVLAGPDLEQASSTVTVAAGSAAWVSVAFKGRKPGVSDAKLKLTQLPPGATISYPGEGSSSGLSADPTLEVGETDSAAFKLDATKLAKGSYTLGVELAYGSGKTFSGTLTLVVS